MVRLVTQRTVNEWGAQHAEARERLRAWAAVVKAAQWSQPTDVLDAFPTASVLAGPKADTRVVFRLGGDWRLVASIWFYGSGRPGGIVYCKWFGSHSDYDDIDAATVTRS